MHARSRTGTCRILRIVARHRLYAGSRGYRLHLVHARLGQAQRWHCQRRGRDGKERIGAESTFRGSSNVFGNGGRALCHFRLVHAVLCRRARHRNGHRSSCRASAEGLLRGAGWLSICVAAWDRPVAIAIRGAGPYSLDRLIDQGTISSRDEAARTAPRIRQAAVRWRCRPTMRIRSSR